MSAIWTVPRTWGTGDLADAAMMNQHLRDNLDFLRNPPSAVDLAATVTTSSASLVDVTGSSITFTTYGGGVLVLVNGIYDCSSVGAAVSISLNVDGATERTFTYENFVANYNTNISFPYKVAALAAGSHTFKIQTATSAGTAIVTLYQIYAWELTTV
ncbi:MAG: hypothetical protein LCI00_16805 [Chloroflexi bacterium]|nr:hypothetical protein [Chloroflexota bacterium]